MDRKKIIIVIALVLILSIIIFLIAIMKLSKSQEITENAENVVEQTQVSINNDVLANVKEDDMQEIEEITDSKEKSLLTLVSTYCTNNELSQITKDDINIEKEEGDLVFISFNVDDERHLLVLLFNSSLNKYTSYMTENEYFYGENDGGAPNNGSDALFTNEQLEEKITALKTYNWFIDVMNYAEIPENVDSLEIYCNMTSITPYIVIKNENEVIIHRANYDTGKFKLNSKNISSDKIIEEVMSYELLMTFDKNTDEVKFLNLQTLELPEVKYLGANL